jgi:hypothetical protein
MPFSQGIRGCDIFDGLIVKATEKHTLGHGVTLAEIFGFR